MASASSAQPFVVSSGSDRPAVPSLWTTAAVPFSVRVRKESTVSWKVLASLVVAAAFTVSPSLSPCHVLLLGLLLLLSLSFRAPCLVVMIVMQPCDDCHRTLLLRCE